MQATTKVSEQQLAGSSGQPVTVLRFSGDVSSSSRDAVLGRYEALDKGTHRQILLDFKGVDYLNSSGIALVIQVLIASSNAGQTIAISGLTPHFTKVFTMVGITKYATLYPDEAAALTKL
ncbi:STAS domain-containing protein [Acidipila sp. EB88]|uniref:STAS domain-containing protein n=1 Tax=Acidipila sp. EB88 TaxID=2305226 RepID=UPI000F5F1132|nr:STAS domain-containing protein [Acidipila sp. EB88]RRA49602.1 anti-sigma factor antagonist [Acidipila sp. EB88]